LRLLRRVFVQSGVISFIRMATFVKTILFTDVDGHRAVKEETIPLDEGNPGSRLSAFSPSGGYQLRHSPVGFRSQFHCTTNSQWVFISSGRMRIGLPDGSSRDFAAGQHFFCADSLPEGAAFDDQVHGHCSCQLGDEPLSHVVCARFMKRQRLAFRLHHEEAAFGFSLHHEEAAFGFSLHHEEAAFGFSLHHEEAAFGFSLHYVAASAENWQASGLNSY